MIETSSGLPPKSSTIFANLGKSSMFGNVRLTFGQILENLRRSSVSSRKSLENRQKRGHQYVFMIKRTLHVSSEICILCSRGKNKISHISFLPLEHYIHTYKLYSCPKKAFQRIQKERKKERKKEKKKN